VQEPHNPQARALSPVAGPGEGVIDPGPGADLHDIGLGEVQVRGMERDIGPVAEVGGEEFFYRWI